MFKLNFKIALRNIWRNRTSSLINISGLAIGLAACLLLLLYVAYEWSFDRQWKDADQIYQVMTNRESANGGIEESSWSTGNTVGPVLKQEYPVVKAMARMSWDAPTLIANGTNSFKRKARFADADILKIFSFTFISGNAETALSSPGNVVLTESTARVLFGQTDVLNRTVRFDDKREMKITGVIKDPLKNTSVGFDYLLPWSLYESLNDWVKEPSWTNYNWTTLVRLDPQADVAELNESVKGLMERHEPDAKAAIFLYPLYKLHLHGDFINGKPVGGKIEQVRLFMGLAIGILLIACINFMNMATAKSERRGKEVGIKKTIGATRGSLVGQFLMESLVLTAFSAVMAVVLIELCLPYFNDMLGINLSINYANAAIWLGIAFIVVLTGLIAGSYPAFYLSSFNPVQILKKRNFNRRMLNFSMRQVLVVGQFSFAVILIIATIVIYKQIQFIKNRPIGYQINQLVEMPQDGTLYDKFDLLKHQLLRSGAVTSLYQSSATLSRDGSSFWGMEWPGSTEADKLLNFDQLATTYDFVKTTGVKLIAGRDFSPEFASDTAALLLNRAAVERMNLKNPIGTVVQYHGVSTTIVGIFDNFIWGSPAKNAKPMAVAFNKGWSGLITMRLNAAHPPAENLATIERVVKSINPAYPVELNFVDRLYAEKLKTEKVLGILSNLFGGLAVFISCLGLFGLAAYSAEQRTKEIGVRKVLGASVGSLMQLLSVSFLKMVTIAIFIAVPLAIYIMNSWLKGYDIHTTISWMIILYAAAGTLMIALLTVSFQAYRAARANPVDALKYE